MLYVFPWHPPYIPGKPVAYNYGLLLGIVACYFGLLGVPGTVISFLQEDQFALNQTRTKTIPYVVLSPHAPNLASIALP